MSDAPSWLNWRPTGLQSPHTSEPPTKPTKPTEPPVALQPPRGVEAAEVHEPVALTESAPPVGELAKMVGEVLPFARIGRGGPLTAPLPPNLAGFVGFDGFVADRNHKNIIETRVGPSGHLVFRPSAPGQYPKPTGFRTVVAGYGSKDQVRYTAARHQITGNNRLGQDSVEFPFCLVSLEAWRQAPVDLRLAEWYRTEQDAIDKYSPHPPEPQAEPLDCVASFVGGLQVELHRENRSRWLMWEVRDGRKTRRRDFASPYLDHAKRTAAFWYGEPVEDWQSLQETKTDAGSRRRGRK
jgi:hypothetical protein